MILNIAFGTGLALVCALAWLLWRNHRLKQRNRFLEEENAHYRRWAEIEHRRIALLAWLMIHQRRDLFPDIQKIELSLLQGVSLEKVEALVDELEFKIATGLYPDSPPQ